MASLMQSRTSCIVRMFGTSTPSAPQSRAFLIQGPDTNGVRTTANMGDGASTSRVCCSVISFHSACSQSRMHQSGPTARAASTTAGEPRSKLVPRTVWPALQQARLSLQANGLIRAP